MRSTKLLAVVALCVAFASPSAQADDHTPLSENAARKLIVIPVTGFDAAEAATELKKYLPEDTGIVILRMPFTNTLVVRGTDAELTVIRELLRPL